MVKKTRFCRNCKHHSYVAGDYMIVCPWCEEWESVSGKAIKTASSERRRKLRITIAEKNCKNPKPTPVRDFEPRINPFFYGY